MDIKKIYSEKNLNSLEKEYEDLNIFDLIKMNFTLQAHQKVVQKLIKRNTKQK